MAYLFGYLMLFWYMEGDSSWLLWFIFWVIVLKRAERHDA